MFISYRRILATPGALQFTLAGLLARLGGAMSGVATIVLIADRRGSYSLAGTVSAAGVASAAVLLPLSGRLVDRYGQARVAVPAVLAGGLPAGGLVLGAHYGAPAWTLIACAAGSATVPNLGGMARARWAYLYREDEEARHRANALEQALDELCFMGGPVLAMLLCTQVFPEAGLLTAQGMCLTGVLLFAAQRRTEPPVQPVQPVRAAPGMHLGPLRVSGLRILVLTFLATGVVFGSMEVTTIAYAGSLGHPTAAGPLLTLVAAGSCGSGLVFGLLRPRRSPATRLLAGVATMAGLLILPLATALYGAGLALLAVALLAAGSGTAPTMVSGMTLIQELLPQRELNEGMSIAVSGILVGISTGAALGGTVAQHTTPGSGYLVTAAAALFALLIAAVGFNRLSPRPAIA